MRPGDDNAKSDVASGVYERHYQLQAGDDVLDLGAHVGYFTEMASEKVGPMGRVIAFEPHPDNFKLLQERVGSALNVTVINAAVGGSERMVLLHHNTGNTGGHSIYKNGQHSKHFIVPCVKSSEYLEDLQVRFVKCDTEGSELEILRDLVPVLMPPIDIAFEAHSAELYAACKELLTSNGFKFEPMTVNVDVCYAWK